MCYTYDGDDAWQDAGRLARCTQTHNKAKKVRWLGERFFFSFENGTRMSLSHGCAGNSVKSGLFYIITIYSNIGTFTMKHRDVLLTNNVLPSLWLNINLGRFAEKLVRFLLRLLRPISGSYHIIISRDNSGILLLAVKWCLLYLRFAVKIHTCALS